MLFIKSTAMRELTDLAEVYRIPSMFTNKSQDYLNNKAEMLQTFLELP